MGGKSSAPASPDYIAAAREQGNQNILAALASASLQTPNVNSPYGSVSWQYTGGSQAPGAAAQTANVGQQLAGQVPAGMTTTMGTGGQFTGSAPAPGGAGGPLSPGDYTMNINLSPEQQRLFEAQTGVQGLISNYLMGGAQNALQAQQQGLNFEGLPELPTGGIDLSGLGVTDRNRIEDALYNRATRFAEPRFERDEATLLNRLSNQGIAPGSEAYNREMSDFRENKDRAFMDIRDRAIELGGTESRADRDQLFREAMAQGTTDFSQAMAGRQQGLDEQLLAQSNPLQQLVQLLQLSQPTLPGQVSGGGQGIAAAPYFDAVNQQYQNQLSNWQSRNATQQANLMGLAQLGTNVAPYAAKALMSDARAKRNIERIGMFRGFPAYRYEYLDGTPSVGVLAQEVLVTRPDAVTLGDDGFLRVNYGAL
jgi:hypothetical protein